MKLTYLGLVILLALSGCTQKSPDDHYPPIIDSYTYDIDADFTPSEHPNDISTNLRRVPYPQAAPAPLPPAQEAWVAAPKAKHHRRVKTKTTSPYKG